jgi:surfeit locus 1 family protein
VEDLSLRFRPDLLPTLAAIITMAVMIKLGFWQYGKAQAKASLQQTYDQRAADAYTAIPSSIDDVELWRYRKLEGKGRYLTELQILLDNQVEKEQAGYHVITPFKTESGALVLVDRGWIPVGDRARLPEVDTPAEVVHVSGFSWIPSTKYFELATPDSTWQPVWQNLDLARYTKASGLQVLPLVIRLDANSQAGGFVRNWVRPAENIEKHLGYALQWWGFAATVLVIWIFVNLRKEKAT